MAQNPRPRPRGSEPPGSDLNFDINRILRILPHRAPFLLIDRVLDINPRTSARALKNITYHEPMMVGHFPGSPIFPAVLTLEAMYQLMCVIAYASNEIDPNLQTFAFAGIDKAKFRHAIVPGDQLIIDVRVLQQRNNVWKCEGTAMTGDVLCAEAELLAAVQDRDD